ncbi:MAG TPA: transcriptional repressor NrdR [Desulfobacteraceae bacterium]|nr:transcriptional repressor NrdR [Deltaproteobacteria bacterium]MBW2356216.1 transcriptional repressor NrdR [Deltaproteobacteria bacterium]RLB98776.1 MAG: transcriptional regulator NrdR [Deltaproteobacteria bacterium]HDI60746.1 transcriptional repressor NrdR [Desulfobacteraceae bacterium]
MKCPFCSESEDKVIDSRLSRSGLEIRRRRECLACGQRFTTYERIEETPLMILKKDGRREEFSREKVRSGILKACEKLDISIHAIEEFLQALEHDLKDSGEKEIPSAVVGERIMGWLHGQSDIAYVRFASVYREFKDVNDFMAELRRLLSNSDGR